MWELLVDQDSVPAAAAPIPAARIAPLDTVPAQFERLILGEESLEALVEAVEALESFDKSRPAAVDIARLLVSLLDQLSERRPIPTGLTARILAQATLAHLAQGLWTAVPLAERLLREAPTTDEACWAPVSAAAVANAHGAYNRTLELLTRAGRTFERRIQDTPGPPVSLADQIEGRQQFLIIQASTLRSYVQAHLDELLRVPSDLHRLTVRIRDLAHQATSMLEVLPTGWEQGMHGGNATLAWTALPALTLAELALVVEAAERRLRRAERSAMRLPVLSFDGYLQEVATRLRQAGAVQGTKAHFHGLVREQRLRLIHAIIVTRDSAAYSEAAVRTRALVAPALDPAAPLDLRDRLGVRRLREIEELAASTFHEQVAPIIHTGSLTDVPANYRSSALYLRRLVRA